MVEFRTKTADGTTIPRLLMRWPKMPTVAISVAVTAAVLLLVTVETASAAGGGAASGEGSGGRLRGVATSTDRLHQDVDNEHPQTPAAVQCSSCLGHETLRTMSLELIKISILNKLGMERPPDFSDRRIPKVPTDLPPFKDLMSTYDYSVGSERGGSVVVVPHIRHDKSHHYDASGDGAGGGSDMQSDEAAGYAAAAASNVDNAGGYADEDDYHVKTHKLIAFAQPHPTTQKIRGHYLLYFTFSEQTGQHRITEAILWLHRRRSDMVVDDQVVTIEVHRINPGSMHPLFVSSIKRVINTTEPGWVSIDLQRRMSDWFKSTDGAKNLTLMVHAYYVNKNMTHAKMPYVTDARKRDDMNEIPYLVVQTENGKRSRSRRSNSLGLDCDGLSKETLCCRYPLTVDFEDFGWNWIIAPLHYEANYCSGECPMVFLQKYPHTHLAQMSNRTGLYPGTGPCCAPRKMSGISMLYFDQQGNIIFGMLPGMVVDRCGCS